MKKYEFAGDVELHRGVTFRRIRALKDFGDVKKGTLGGWIEKEENLTQDGNARVFGNARVSGNAEVSGNAHILVIGRVGSRNGFTTFFRDKNKEISVVCGCFLGTIEEFKKKVKETHGTDTKFAKVYQMAADLAEVQIELKGDNKYE